MATKKTKTKAKKTKPEMIKVEKQVVTDLASAVLWALKFLKTKSGAGMWTKLPTAPGEKMVIMPWQEKFMDALDGVGYCLDRKEFWKKQDGKATKKKAKVPRKDIRVQGLPS